MMGQDCNGNKIKSKAIRLLQLRGRAQKKSGGEQSVDTGELIESLD